MPALMGVAQCPQQGPAGLLPGTGATFPGNLSGILAELEALWGFGHVVMLGSIWTCETTVTCLLLGNNFC